MAKGNQANSSKLHDQGVYERDGTMEALIGELEAISELDKHSEAGLEAAGKKRTWGFWLMLLGTSGRACRWISPHLKPEYWHCIVNNRAGKYR